MVYPDVSGVAVRYTKGRTRLNRCGMGANVKENTIIIRMAGGLGNQMFQYALYLKLCSQGKEVKFDDINEYRHDNARPIMLSVFGINYPRAAWDEIVEITDGSMKILHRIRRKLTGRKTLEYREKNDSYDPQALTIAPAYLTGYYQSEKYFKDIEEQVREVFTFPERSQMHLPEGLDQKIGTYVYMIEHTEAISIHIRRGDYLLVDDVFGGICTDAYYEQAIAYMLEKCENPVFYVFSNDLKWIRAWIKERYLNQGDEQAEEELDRRFCFIEETTEHTGFLDMMMMSKCKHHIIANSSFSWWGAWLNNSPDKCIVAPSKWLNSSGCQDVHTDHMIKINAEGEICE